MHTGSELVQKALKPIHQGCDFHSVTDSELDESVHIPQLLQLSNNYTSAKLSHNSNVM